MQKQLKSVDYCLSSVATFWWYRGFNTGETLLTGNWTLPIQSLAEERPQRCFFRPALQRQFLSHGGALFCIALACAGLTETSKHRNCSYFLKYFSGILWDNGSIFIIFASISLYHFYSLLSRIRACIC